MIIADNKTEVTTQGIGRTAQATIKASARLFNFFSDMIYSDSYVAIWRELVANGVDAQVEAKTNDRAVVVTLPTDYTPYAKVRDFGTGMSELFLVGDDYTPSKFMAFTDASTKEMSNEAIGGFGIGSKAPLSYTEQFAIRSYQQGIVKVYSVFKDDEGCPRIAKLSQSETDEPDGIEISFPVEGKDIRLFRDAAMTTLRYFTPTPILENSESQLQAPEYTVRTPTWGFLAGANNSRVVMGGIAYPIDAGHCKELDELLEFGIDFYVPIGACSIALSREALMYDDRTIRVLKTLADSIKPDLEKHVCAMFADCKTEWEARKLYAQQIARGYGSRTRMISAHARYKDVKLNAAFKYKSGKFLLGLVTRSRYNKSNYGYWTEGRNSPTIRAWVTDIHPKDIDVVLIDDAPTKPILRMRQFLEDNDNVAIFRPNPHAPPTKLDWGKLLVKLGRPNYVLLSSIEPAVVTRGPRAAPTVKVVHGYKSSNFMPPSRTKAPVTVLPDGGYYMAMENFGHLDKCGRDLVQATAQQLSASLTTDDIYWFNKGDFEAIKDNPKWVPAKVAFDKKLETYRKDHRNMPLASAFHDLYRRRYNYSGGNTVAPLLALLLELANIAHFKQPKQGPIAQLAKLHSLVATELTSGDAVMRGVLEVKCDKQIEMLTKIVQAAELKYPELTTLISHDRGISTKLVNVYNKLI